MALQNTSIAKAGSNGHHNFILYISEHSTNIANNTSNIGWTLQLIPIHTGYDWSYTGAMSWSVSIAGKSYSGSLGYYDGKSTIDIASDTFDVAHSADGSKSISFSFSISSYNYSYLPGSASNSGTLALTQINRLATLTSAPNFNDTETPTITYTNPSGSAVLVGAYCQTTDGTGLMSQWTASGSTSYTFTIGENDKYRLRNAVVSGTSATVVFKVKTYDLNYNELGVSSLTRTFTLTNATPSLAPVVYDDWAKSTELTGDSSVVIKGYNSMSVSSGATAYKGASIASNKITCGSKSINTATGRLVDVESGVFEFEATDSRGNVVRATRTLDVIDYKTLTVNLDVEAPNTSGDMRFSLNGTYWSGNFGEKDNTLTLEYRVKVNDEEWGSWIPVSPNIDTSRNTYEIDIEMTELNYLNSYTIQARAFDEIIYNGIATPEKRVKTTPVFDWSETDFNLNVPLMINNVEQDAIVESGSSGIWNYKKYESGIAECWGRFSFSTTLNTAWGSMYVGSTKSSKQTYPITFVESPVENATLLATNYAAWIFPESGSNGINSTTQTAVYNVCRPTTGGTSTHTFFICLQVVGRWK